MHRGYIRLWRSVEDFDWYKNPIVMSLWIHILLNANHSDKNWQGSTIKRGSFITSLKSLSFNTGLSVQQVRTAISKLEATNNITSKSTNKNRLITVINYDKFQNDNKQNEKLVTNNQQTNNKQITTTNNNKALNNNKKEVTKRFVPPTIYEINEYCKSKGYNVDAEQFYSYYESVGWKVGKNKMKSWKSALTTWHRRNKVNTKGSHNHDYSDFKEL